MKKYGLFISFVLIALSSLAQVNVALRRRMAVIDGATKNLGIEKLYLQTDKPYYISGDTIRFKAYLLNADYLTPSTHSGLLYVELDDAANNATRQMMVAVTSGVSWGNIVLNEKEILPGSYTIRAYTNWMRNFGEDYIFKKSIYISAVKSNTMLIGAGFKVDNQQAKATIKANLHFTRLDQEPVRLKNMQVTVLNNGRGMFKYNTITGMDGSINLDFDLPDKTMTKNLYLQAKQTGKGADTTVFTIPVIINRAANTDVQFMPEGGNMLAGMPAKIGFKAIGEDGKGVNISGKLYNAAHQEILGFKTAHNGMGSFRLTPQPGENYTAEVLLPDNTIKSYGIPAVKSSGTAMQVTAKGADSLQLTLGTIKDTGLDGKMYYLIGQGRGVVCYAATLKFDNAVMTYTFPTKLFPTGIAYFTLLDEANQPLNERLVYIDHKDNLQINLTTNQPGFGLRDSVAMTIQVKDKDGKPVQGNFSLAVTDDTQVRTDSLGGNIINNLLFSSDLKGTIEEPGWYFEKSNADRSDALDDLLLTQGWVGYTWPQLFDQSAKVPKYPAEKEFIVQGTVLNAFNKPVKNTPLILFQKKPVLVMEDKTDNAGRFAFKGLFPVDTAFYLLQTKKTFNVGITMDEFVPPVFALAALRTMPWYINSDTLLLKNTNTKLAQLAAEDNLTGAGHLLKEVTIKETERIPGSKNPHPYADILINEKEMNAAKHQTLFDYLSRRDKSLMRETFGDINHAVYIFKRSYYIVLVVDGRYCHDTELYMNNLLAEDIKGIEIVFNIGMGQYDPAITYITTYSGDGQFISHTPGKYPYKPMPFSSAKQFYSPKYTAQNKAVGVGIDLRSTIHWEPNVTTDAGGMSTISFYTADKPANYSVIMEGTDLKGNFGYIRGKIKVNPPK